MKERDRAAIEAVARHFSATWEAGEAPPDAYLSIGKRRIELDIAVIEPRVAVGGGLAKPRLRFDRVALRLVQRLQTDLHEAVPEGTTAIVTVTAPIRLPAKTIVGLQEKILVCLAEKSTRAELSDTIHGNEIRVRIVGGSPAGASRVIGYVHNPDCNGDVLLDATESLLACLGGKTGRRRSPIVVGERWLAIVNEGGPNAETYRQVYAQLDMPTAFTKIVMVAGDRVESLTD